MEEFQDGEENPEPIRKKRGRRPLEDFEASPSTLKRRARKEKSYIDGPSDGLDKAIQKSRTIRLNQVQEGFFFSKAPYCLMDGGVGNGKSLAARMKVAYRFLPKKECQVLIGMRDKGLLRRSLVPEFFSEEKGFPTLEQYYRKGLMECHLPHGGRIFFVYLDPSKIREGRAFTNMNLTGAWLEQAEDADEDSFFAIVKRGRRDEEFQINLTCNPNGYDWIWKLWYKREIPKTGVDFIDRFGASAYRKFVGTFRDNMRNLPTNYIHSLLGSNLPKDQQDQMIWGWRRHATGLVHPSFFFNKHVLFPKDWPFDPKNMEKVKRDGWTLWQSLDWGVKEPTCVLFFASPPGGTQVYVYQQIYRPQTGHTIQELCEEIKLIRGEWSNRPPVYSDPKSLWERRPTGDRIPIVLADQFDRFGVSVSPGALSAVAGRELINQMFSDGSLFFLSSMMEKEPGTLDEIQHLRWRPPSVLITAQTSRRIEPTIGPDHGIAALRYGLLDVDWVRQRIDSDSETPWRKKYFDANGRFREPGDSRSAGNPNLPYIGRRW